MLRHNRIIGAKDHASIQMNVAEVDKVTGRFNGPSGQGEAGLQCSHHEALPALGEPWWRGGLCPRGSGAGATPLDSYTR